MTSYVTEFRQRVLREGKYSILDKNFVFVDLCDYGSIEYWNDRLKEEEKTAKKYKLKSCKVLDVALNSDSEYMVKFNDGKIKKVCCSCLFQAINKETGRELEYYNDSIDFNLYKLKRA